MKYMLVSVIDRDIYTPEFFDTHEEAHNKMCEEVADVWEVPTAEIKESYLAGEEYDDRTCVIKNAAWTEHHGRDFDWKIFIINDAGEIIN